jgi:hypothetical protein
MPTTSEVALGALVEEQCILQVARRRDFLRSSIWPRRVALIIVVELLTFGVAIDMCAFGIGLESRPLPHPACSVAIKCSAHLEVSGSSRISAGPAAGVMTSPKSVQTSSHRSALHTSCHPQTPFSHSPTTCYYAYAGCCCNPYSRYDAPPSTASWCIRWKYMFDKKGPEKPRRLLR